MKSFNHSSYLDAVMDALIEKIHRQPVMVQEPAQLVDRATKRRIKHGVERKYEALIYSPPSEAESSFKASDNSSVTR